ncbi:putative serine/threonine-protein kinase YbdM [Paenibacillus solanacearum]|uniref:non-specific serine/threonine protein kinase n=1 Tax=Paenibacillus solanacearum TaxID=2048548 RepID=A0A916K6R4_9BACL|nr:protein kinase family protein [Paenibacillus solanacearum]CAG7635666.1 putative serine/threonine-protein kinase YbdM [Paenibacillus solanacearum]
MLNYMKEVHPAWIDYPLREGKRLAAGRYCVERFLGAGSYGLTYMCRELATGQPVVIKQPKPSKGKLGIELLLREADILKALEHPAIPRWIETFMHHKRPFLVMSHMQGETVEELLFEQHTVFSERQSLRLLRGVASIAGFIHNQGYVHLDLRPPNVIVQGERLYLIDFGLAARIGEPARVEPNADEEAWRRRMAEPDSDLYALGHFLLFLLYSGYEAADERRASILSNGGDVPGWEQELEMRPETRRILRKLLQLDAPYPGAAALLHDVEAAEARLAEG